MSVATTAAKRAGSETAPKTGLRRLGAEGLLVVAVFLTAGLRRRNWLTLFQTIAVVGVLILLPSCGGGGNGGGGGDGGGTTTGSYTVTVTAMSGSYSTNVGIPLTVQ